MAIQSIEGVEFSGAKVAFEGSAVPGAVRGDVFHVVIAG